MSAWVDDQFRRLREELERTKKERDAHELLKLRALQELEATRTQLRALQEEHAKCKGEGQ